MERKIVRKLIAIEIKLGFLHIPARGINQMPNKNIHLSVIFDNRERKLSYNAKHKRIFGLTRWYKKNKASVGDKVVLQKNKDNYILSFDKKRTSKPLEEAEALIDISGLTSQAKGDIVEERIKELIVLYGQGLLSVYRPVTDTQGIDLIVTKSGMFQPIFLQIKGRFNVQKRGYFLMDINKKTFNVHHSCFVVGAYFNPQEMEINNQVLLIPSDKIAKAPTVSSNTGERYRVSNYLNVSSKGRWAPYLTKKSELANKLIEKFEEIEKYIK